MDPTMVLGLLGGLKGGGSTKVNTNTSLNNNISLSLSNTTGGAPATSSTGSNTASSSQTAGGADADDLPSMPSTVIGSDTLENPAATLETLKGNTPVNTKGLLILGGLVAAGGTAWYFMKRGR